MPKKKNSSKAKTRIPIINSPLVLMKNAESLHDGSLALASPSVVRKQADKIKEGRNDGRGEKKQSDDAVGVTVQTSV